MIFLTVGTQLPFDRLVRAVDAWCAETGRDDVFGQIADPGPDGYYPTHFTWTRFVDPPTFSRHFEEARVVVGHAGMGTIIGAMTLCKPVVVLPRKGALGEHRNDHQVATARRFRDRPLVHVAAETEDLGPLLSRVSGEGETTKGETTVSPFASDQLIDALRGFIHRRNDGSDGSRGPTSP